MGEKSTPVREATERALWERVRQGDKKAFWEVVEPLLPELLYRARHDVAYHRSMGDLLPGEPEPHEVVADALARAWRLRSRKPADQSVRVWLLGTLHRVIRDRVRQERGLQRFWALALEDPVTEGSAEALDETFYDWYQPDDAPRWEDLLPGPAPSPEECVELEELGARPDPDARQAVVLRDEHGLTHEEIAHVLGRSVEEVDGLLNRGRAETKTRKDPSVQTEEERP